MIGLNQRELKSTATVAWTDTAMKRRISILEEFPYEPLEAVVLQWEHALPTVLIQLKRDPSEPLQFPKKRPDVPGNSELSKDLPLAIDSPLHDFVDPSSSLIFGKPAWEADILFSMKAFSFLQPEPDLVLPAESLWECRTEALRSLRIADEIGINQPIQTP